MENRIIILAHKRTVGSGSALAAALGGKCIVPKFAPKGGFKAGDVVLNYGVGTAPEYSTRMLDAGVTFLNTPMSVRGAINKVDAINKFRNAMVPTLTMFTNFSDALYHLESEGGKMFCRTLKCGSQGEGITVHTNVSDMSCDPLRDEYKFFTDGFPKTKEFRLHVFNGEVIDYAQKKRMGKEKLEAIGLTEADRSIRSHDRGWVFAKVDTFDYPEVRQAAINAVKALGLDFGAVDILTTTHKGQLSRLAVCEVNTAPSLSAESTLNAYVEAIKNNFG